MIYIIQESLLQNEKYPLNNNLFVKHPTVKEILDFGEENYFILLGMFLFNKTDLATYLCDIDCLDFKTYSDFDIFMGIYRSNEMHQELVKFFLGDVDFCAFCNTSTNECVLYDAQKDIVLDKASYETMSSFIRSIHYLPDVVDEAMSSEIVIKAERIVREYQDKHFNLHDNSEGFISDLITNAILFLGYKRSQLEQMKIYEFHSIFQKK